MNRFFSGVLLLAGLLISAQGSFAQDSTQKQIWPEVEVYYRINERFRLYGLISGTKANSEYSEGSAAINVDYFALPWLRGKRHVELNDTALGYFWWFRAGYSYSNSFDEDKPKLVNTITTETNNSFFLPSAIILATRNRLDWRFVNGVFQPIYRPRIKFVKNFSTQYLSFNAYIWTEYFFYLNDNSQNRLRLTAGTVIKVTRNVDLELYYLYQFQNKPSVAPLNAIGVQLDFYFRSKKYRAEEKKKP